MWFLDVCRFKGRALLQSYANQLNTEGLGAGSFGTPILSSTRAHNLSSGFFCFFLKTIFITTFFVSLFVCLLACLPACLPACFSFKCSLHFFTVGQLLLIEFIVTRIPLALKQCSTEPLLTSWTRKSAWSFRTRHRRILRPQPHAGQVPSGKNWQLGSFLFQCSAQIAMCADGQEKGDYWETR